MSRHDGWLGLSPWLDEEILRIGEMHTCVPVESFPEMIDMWDLP